MGCAGQQNRMFLTPLQGRGRGGFAAIAGVRYHDVMSTTNPQPGARRVLALNGNANGNNPCALRVWEGVVV